MAQKRVPTLTKKDVARRVAELRGEPIYKSEPWVTDVITALRELMLGADPEIRIELRDFGVFEVKKTKAKPKARNPKTNETVFIPSRRKTHFKPSKRVKLELQQPLADLGYSIPEGSADYTPTNGRKNGTAKKTNGTARKKELSGA
ncbi:MAG: HU family DNA-binding protein [Bacteroidota bacterium]